MLAALAFGINPIAAKALSTAKVYERKTADKTLWRDVCLFSQGESFGKPQRGWRKAQSRARHREIQRRHRRNA